MIFPNITYQVNHPNKTSSIGQTGQKLHMVNWTGTRPSGFQIILPQKTRITLYLTKITVLLIHKEIPSTKPSESNPSWILSEHSQVLLQSNVYKSPGTNATLSEKILNLKTLQQEVDEVIEICKNQMVKTPSWDDSQYVVQPQRCLGKHTNYVQRGERSSHISKTNSNEASIGRPCWNGWR